MLVDGGFGEEGEGDRGGDGRNGGIWEVDVGERDDGCGGLVGEVGFGIELRRRRGWSGMRWERD